MKARVLHVITGLGLGGAEMALLRLLGALRNEFDAEVLSLTTEEPLGAPIRALGVPVRALGRSAGVPDPRLLTGVVSAVRRFRPDLIQTWMYHADLVGGLAGRLTGVPVVWGVHYALARDADLKLLTRVVVWINARLSRRVPRTIVYCADAGRARHESLGYDPTRGLVIPNGLDPTRFRPDPPARLAVRSALGLEPSAPLIGLCARYHPDKDHRTFLRAAAILARARPDVHFVLWGRDVEEANPVLADLVRAGGLSGRVHLLGQRDDSARLHAALDVGALSSVTEALPTAVIEAMACGVPCAVTDVGDAAAIVGGTGRVVPPGDPAALARAWEDLLALSPAERQALGEAARRRVEERYSLEKMAAAYARLYRDIMAGMRA